MYGCVGALDGLFIRKKRPSRRECKDPMAYWNRKGFSALFVQALCVAEERVTFISTRCTGPTHDATAFAISGLHSALEDSVLPEGYSIASDEAYPCSEQMLTPWCGRDLSPD